MSASSNSKPRPRIRFVVLAAVIALPLLYYGAQALLRSAPLGGFMLIGHRGGRAYAPENTLAAFRHAIRMGSVWLEFDHTVIQSFEPDSLNKLRQLNPQARLCALYGLWQLNDSHPAGNAEYVCPMGEMVVLNPYMIRQAHNEGRRVLVWFGALQYPFLYRLVEFFGVDGIIADDPLAVRQTLQP